jgi:hypothetical protein
MKTLLSLILLSAFASNNPKPLFNVLDDGGGSGVAANSCSVGTAVSGKKGILSLSYKDMSGNLSAPTTGSYDGKVPVHVMDAQVGAASATTSRVTFTTANVSQVLVAANTDRKFLYIENNSGAVLYLGFGSAAVGSQGLSVANSALFTIDYTNLFTGAIYGVFTSNNRTVDAIEGY